jgi:hypothetical protein
VKGLNFVVTNPHSNLDVACAVESIVLKLPDSGHGIQEEDQVQVREVSQLRMRGKYKKSFLNIKLLFLHT